MTHRSAERWAWPHGEPHLICARHRFYRILRRSCTSDGTDAAPLRLRGTRSAMAEYECAQGNKRSYRVCRCVLPIRWHERKPTRTIRSRVRSHANRRCDRTRERGGEEEGERGERASGQEDEDGSIKGSEGGSEGAAMGNRRTRGEGVARGERGQE